MKNAAVVILSHQGYSFVDDLIELCRNLGLKPLVLSSLVDADTTKRSDDLRKVCSEFKMTNSLALSKSDVNKFASSMTKIGYDVLACITVWEGYRLMMASLNKTLGANDESPLKIARILDKFVQRADLKRLGLSQIGSRILSNEEAKVSPAKTLFVKPRFGLGSFGAFKWESGDISAKIKSLVAQMKSDALYAGVFQKEPDFVAEDEIHGQEYSFEAIADSGTYSILATHEKLDLVADHGSVLENTCISPPIKLSGENLDLGHEFIFKVLRDLGLRQGCYHIEARFAEDSGVWEIIEINPRIGGAYIKQSTKWVSGECLLRLWLETLISKPKWMALRLDRKTDHLGSAPRAKGQSFFRVYFGEPGKTIANISTTDIGISPAYFRQMAKAGEALPTSSREIFIGQALWQLGSETTREEILKLNQRSLDYLEIKYA